MKNLTLFDILIERIDTSQFYLLKILAIPERRDDNLINMSQMPNLCIDTGSISV
jgi:hypothetical protein